MFTHLHVHSHYSLLDGLPKIDELIARAKELGMKSIALTDHGVMYGLIEFYQRAKETGIKPILGCEIYLAPNGMFQKRGKIDTKPYHLVLLCKNIKGYQNLIKIVTAAHLEGYYYKPRVDFEFLKQHSEGLIALTSCLEGEIPRLVVLKKIQEAEKRALEYEKIFGKGNFYLELQRHPNLPEQEIANQGLISISKKYNIPLVATCDSHYLLKEDAEIQDILLCVQMQKKIQDKDRLSMMNEDFSLRAPLEMQELFKDAPEALKNTEKIAAMCNVELELKKIKLPKFEVPKPYNPNSYLKKLAYEGLVKKFGIRIQENEKVKKQENKLTAEIIKRLEYELAVIEKTGFASYLLIVADFVNWAKKNKIVTGPGRGSAAGSLICYLLNITEINPIKYDLLFERFLNPERISMPDIDMDFSDTRRDEVIEYVRKKYGKNHVAQIITFGKMASRAAVRDVVRVLGYPYSFGDQISKMIPMFMTIKEARKNILELKELYEQNPDAKKILDYAKKLEGVARHASMHACGVVIAPENLDNYVPQQYATQDDKTIVTQYEMHAIEDLGLLKIDFLGLKNLTIVQNAIKIIEKIHGVKINIDKIPFDDKKTFELLQKGNSTGVFQLECLSGNTIISNTTIKKLFEKKNKKVLESVYLDEGKVHKNKIINVLKSAKKELYTLIAENNWYIKASKDHYFLTEKGWKKLEDVRIGEKVLIKTKTKHLVYNICKICGKQISGQKNGKSNLCYRCSAAFYKNPSKKKSREKIKASQIKFYQNGGKPWNYGVTTKNNDIWKETAKKISKALIGRKLEELWGKEKAEKFKQTLSQRSKGANNPMFGKPPPHRKGGFRKDLGHYVRSTWEADFARVLKLHKLDYEYESKTFLLKKQNGEIIHYTPDFYIPFENTFYEIKGWMHDLDKEKIELFQKQYPQHTLIVISATKFAEFALKYKTLIDWECPRIPTQTSFQFIKIKEIKYNNEEIVYDIVMQSPGNNFVANGFLVHNSSGMKRYLKQLKPTEFENIIAMVSLYRPGPIEWIPEYILRKQGRKQITYIHSKLKKALEKTYGVPIYQEQVMQIAQDVAGFTLAEADVLRKAVGKKIRHLLLEQRKKFIQGATANNVPENIAQEIFAFIEPFAGYGFNRSHGACYAMIAYQTAYLKAHFPAEFMAALLTSDQEDTDRVAIEIQECNEMKIEVLPPDVNESFTTFAVINKEGKQVIRFDLNAIKNLGKDIASHIVEERKKNGKFKNFDDFIKRMAIQKFNKKFLESLAKSGALDSLCERNQVLKNVDKILIYSRNIQKTKECGQTDLFGNSLLSAYSPQLKLDKTEPASQKERLAWEKELLGLYVSSHPLKDFKDYLENKTLISRNLNSCVGRQKITVGGVITKIKKIITKTAEPMLFVQLEDTQGNFEVLVFPKILKKDPAIWQEDKVVLIDGKISDRDGEIKVLCDSALEINPSSVILWRKNYNEKSLAKNGNAKSIEITLPYNASRETLYKLKDLFELNKGENQILLRIPENNGNFKIIKAKTLIDANYGLIEKIENFVGKGNVRLILNKKFQ